MRLDTSIVINRPVDEVWAFRTDFFNLPRLSGLTLRVRQTSPSPLGLGATLQGRVAILGFEVQASATVTEWDPPHALSLSGKGLGLRSATMRQTYEATADGTRVVNRGEFEPRPALKPLWWLLLPYLKRRANVGEQRMKRLLEAGKDQRRA